jgi:hypothetical protein
MFYLFFRHPVQVFYLDVAYVSHVCCKWFMWMLHMLAMVFMSFQMFCKCCRRILQVFQLFHMHVVSVLSRCFKSRSDVAHIAM